MPFGETTDARMEEVARQVVDSAWRVYNYFGPGLLESVYEGALARELMGRGLRVERQVRVPAYYEGVLISEEAFRLDLLVEGLVVIELKSVEKMRPVFHAQLKTYLKLSGHRLGFLINFNEAVFREGIKRIIVTP